MSRARTFHDKPIRTVKDWYGEDWDVYTERKTKAGIDLCEGWPHGKNGLDGTGWRYSQILTVELVNYLQQTRYSDAVKMLGICKTQISKFRQKLDIQTKMVYIDEEWLIEHQDEIVYSNLKELQEKYNLSKSQIYARVKILEKRLEVPTQRKSRISDESLALEKWYQQHKDELYLLGTEIIKAQFNFSPFLAKKYYERSCLEHSQSPKTFRKKQQADRKVKHKWLIKHKDELLNPNLTKAQIAQKLNKTESQIHTARAELRKLFNLPTPLELDDQWLLKHQDDLLNPNLRGADLAEKFNLNKKQVTARIERLRLLLNLPKPDNPIHIWREQNKDLILSTDLSIAEIAEQLDKSKQYITNTRFILRKLLEKQASNLY